MFVTLSRLVLMACLLIPSLSWGLGLGEIHLNSSLNEPMSAEIDLIAAGPEELAALRASLAPKDAFTLPLRPISELLQFHAASSDLHRSRVRGMVSLRRADGSVEVVAMKPGFIIGSAPVPVRLTVETAVWLLVSELLSHLLYQQHLVAEMLEVASRTDELTHLSNRRDLEARLARSTTRDTLVMCDLRGYGDSSRPEDKPEKAKPGKFKDW